MSPVAGWFLANAIEREVEGKPVTLASQAANDADGYVREMGMPTERFPRMDVGKMHFDKGNGHGRQSVTHCDAGVGVAARVDNNESHSFVAGSLDAIDQVTLMVALEGNQFNRSSLGLFCERCIDVPKGIQPIDIRLSGSEKIQVWTMHYENALLAIGILG